MERLQAVLLVGGPGTRLRPLTNDRPKSTVPVLNRPVLEHTLAYLKQYNVRDVIITLNYLPEVIESRFGDGRRYGVHLTYCLEVEPRGTAGAVKNAEPYISGSFFVLNGDVFTDMSLDDMLTFHRRKKARATIALTQVDNPSAFGVVETDEDGRVKRFIEKPPPGTETTNWINAGTYILEPEILLEIPADCHYMFEKGLFPRLLETGKSVYGYPYKGYWLDMGTPAHYYCINIDILSDKARSPLYQGNGNRPTYNKKKVEIHQSAVIEGPAVIDSGCIIGAGVKIKGPAAIGRDCRFHEGVKIEKAVIWEGVTIGANSWVKGCVISSGTIIGENQKIENCIVTPSQTAPLYRPVSKSK